jgi:hypothetical protein
VARIGAALVVVLAAGASIATEGVSSRPHELVPLAVELVDGSLRDSESGRLVPRALAAGDLDEDGIPDLVCAYADVGGGLLTVHRGNIDAIYPDRPDARRRRREGTLVQAPFFPEIRVFEVPERPDHLVSGDFDRDGHLDVVTAAQGSRWLYLLTGDGSGGLDRAEPIKLGGALTAMVAGEIGRADGLVDLVVGVHGSDGPGVLVYAGPEGALRSEPERVALHVAAVALALGDLDGSGRFDLVVGGGSETTILHRGGARSGPTQVETLRRFDASVDAVTIGNFRRGRNLHRQIAVLTADGTIHVLERDGARENPVPETWVEPLSFDRATTERVTPTRETSPGPHPWEELATLRLQIPVGSHAEASVGRKGLLASRLSGSRANDLVVIDGSEPRLTVVDGGVPVGPAEPESADGDESIALTGRPIAVLSMRLNGDALTDLVVLQEDTVEPVLVLSAVLRNITVNWVGDVVNDGNNRCTLREAIINANSDSDTTDGDCNHGDGTDTIRFNIDGGGARKRITLNSGMEPITEALTIDGDSQGCPTPPCIEINGSSAGSGAQGFIVDSSGVTIRGLAIHSFGERGIFTVNSSGTIIEGNFIGTDVTGTADLGNGDVGVQIQNSSDSTIGGTSAAARNVISGNEKSGIFMVLNGSTGNQVQGNLIGTDVTGTVDLGNSFDGVSIDAAPNNTIGGTAVGAGNVISGNDYHGILFQNLNAPSGATGNLVQGNLIGTDVSGTLDLGNTVDGVLIFATSDNTIGSMAAGAGNAISGNDRHGVTILDTGASGNDVLGNFIGTDISGTVDLGNTIDGVFIAAASDNTIGGTAAGARNVISGNDDEGIHIDDDASGNQVLGNFLGTDVTGTEGLGNSGNGIVVDNAADNSVGGIAEGAANVISGSGNAGVIVKGADATGNLVEGNLIGMDVGGTRALGNLGGGVRIWDAASNNVIGGASPGARNIISGNASEGIVLTSGAIGNRIEGNSIGVDIHGEPVVGQSSDFGVRISDASGNTIGGTAPGEGNIIAGFEGQGGVGIIESVSIGNAILGNSIFSNAIGIDLQGDGVTVNDPGDGDSGPNHLGNFPVLTSAAVGTAGTIISGSLDSTPGSTFRLEFYSNLGCHTTGHGEGEGFLGASDVVTDGSGQADFAVVLPTTVTLGDWITSTATSPDNSTSEFSQCATFIANCALDPFGQSVVALDRDTLMWSAPVDIRYARGDLAGVGSYATTDGGVRLGATSLDISGDLPDPGHGMYYMIRARECGSWQTTPGSEPGRDLEFRRNVIPNGGMEDWSSATDLDGWNETANGGSVDEEVDPPDIYGGLRAARLNRSTSSGAINIYTTHVPLIPAESYAFSFRVKSSLDLSGAAQVRVYNRTRGEDLQPDGTWSSSTNFFRFDATTAYEQYGIPFVVDSGHGAGDDYWLIIRPNPGAPIGSSVWIDEVEVRPQ